MPHIELPFPDTQWSDASHGAGCSTCSAIAPELREKFDEFPHVKRYLHTMPIEELGVPKFAEKLDRAMGADDQPNYIYPVGNSVFAHVLFDAKDARNWYVPIEPVILSNYDELMAIVEELLVDAVHKFTQPASNDEQREVLLHALDKVISVKSQGSLAPSDGWQKPKASKRISIGQIDLDAIRYLLLRDKVGLGILDGMILDPNIEDVSCAGLGPVFIEHKVFKALKSTVIFDRHDDLDAFLRRTSERIKKPVTYRKPIVDATLPDGSRVNIVYGAEVSKRGSNFTIRKFTATPLSVMDVINGGACTYQMIAYLSIMIEEGMNLWVSGETASGKTTLLNALTTFYSGDSKIVTVEDTPEVQVPHPNWIREVVRGAAGEASSVTMFDLLKAALRQRPNAIIIGEIRGEEGNIAFQAMQTGHAVMATFHAATVEKLIQRVTAAPILVPKSYMDNLNLVVIASAVKLPNGKLGRRVMSINELFGYDSVTDSFSFAEVFHWDPITDVHEFTGYMNSYLLENKVAPARGIPPNQRRRIYQEIDRRAKVLEKLHTGSNITDFYELYKVLGNAKKQGLF
ncbi:MAG: type II/IV secretion system ATPase subunit [Dehalococcoidia bacterium]